MGHFVPGSVITQGFGNSQFSYERFGITRNGGYFHDGQDEAVPTGTPVKAPEDGKVGYWGRETYGAGNYILFEGRSGYELVMMHLSRYGKFGDVRKGDVIGYVGSTGNSSGPHLHTTVYPPNRNRYNGTKGAIHPDEYFAKIGAVNPLAAANHTNKVEAVRGSIELITGVRHDDKDIEKYHLGKSAAFTPAEKKALADKFYDGRPDSEYVKAGLRAYQAAYGRRPEKQAEWEGEMAKHAIARTSIPKLYQQLARR